MPDFQMPKIIVIGFTRKYRKVLVKDATNPADKGEMKLVEDDWVTYAPSHSPMNSRTSDRIRSIDPSFFEVNENNDDSGRKLELMRYRWSLIAPAYEAWKAGREIPVNGTPLAIWPGVMPEVADVLRAAAIKTVEQVRDMTEKQIEQIRLPNLRELKTSAGIFLANSGVAQQAEREAKKDEQIAAMMEMIAELQAQVGSKTVEHDVDEAARPRRAGKPKDEAAEAEAA